ncbi:TPA: cytochrome b561 [Serratia rubidaea]|nr:cytochrome b561 [Serratia rubidaea]HDJ1448646.1 cytochrome b561 [Serratia rubidaea]HDJ1462427.1 cytochrome b561 [Serratia rubidaea]HDJ2774271.1 cytochrome b561 [Serratia rubidaea]
MDKKFAPSQIVFHWLVLVLVVVAYAAMELKGLAPRGSSARTNMAIVHYTAGFSVLIAMLCRVGLKFNHRDPAILPPPPRWQTIAAKAVHGVLYLMFISLPLLGVLSLYVGQIHWSFFSLNMPVSSIRNPELQRSLKNIHEFIANSGYFIIGLHAAAALLHHYVMRDNTLLRMLPCTKVHKPD